MFLKGPSTVLEGSASRFFLIALRALRALAESVDTVDFFGTDFFRSDFFGVGIFRVDTTLPKCFLKGTIYCLEGSALVSS